MRITADTNILVTAITGGDEQQSTLAQTELESAEVVALAVPVLCELVWVLSQGYGIPLPEIAVAIRRLIDSSNVVLDRPAAEFGLALMDAGGDFADGVIAYEGSWLGADTFVSFDRKAVRLIAASAAGWRHTRVRPDRPRHASARLATTNRPSPRSLSRYAGEGAMLRGTYCPGACIVSGLQAVGS